MRKLAVWVGLLAFANSGVAVNNPNLKPSFADLTWYSNRSAVKQQMASRGYVFITEIEDGGAKDSSYSGKLLGFPVKVKHWFNNKNQLVKTSVVLDKSYTSDHYSNFNTIVSALNSKYGLGKLENNVDKDYTDMDEMLAMELGRGKKLEASWYFSTFNYVVFARVSQIYVDNRDYYLNINYESPSWGKELDRRGQKGDL